MPDLSQNVEAILREVAHKIVMPSFKNLAADDIENKSSGELVTRVDRLAESFIASNLARLIACPVIGEEAASQEPALLDANEHEQIWLIDPLDGTSNFVAGRPAFSIMVALLRRGHAVQSWMFNPIADTMDTAELGGGACRNGERVQCSQKSHVAKDLTAIVKTRFLPDELKRQIANRSTRLGGLVTGSDCAGIDYPNLVRGYTDLILYWRTLPWDHAPGVLYLTEAGGRVARLDASTYFPLDGKAGLLVAASAEVWRIGSNALLVN